MNSKANSASVAIDSADIRADAGAVEGPRVRANNAVLPVSVDGSAAITVRPEMGGGPVHLVIDVNGYFAP